MSALCSQFLDDSYFVLDFLIDFVLTAANNKGTDDFSCKGLSRQQCFLSLETHLVLTFIIHLLDISESTERGDT